MDDEGSFKQFKTAFIEEDGLYIPKDPSNNVYRHFGIKRGKELLLSRDELLYIYSNSPPPNATLLTRAYFELKNSDLNILAADEGGASFIYTKTKHFCRNGAAPLAMLDYHGRDESISTVDCDTVVGVLGTETLCFVKLQPIARLSPWTPGDLYKPGGAAI